MQCNMLRFYKRASEWDGGGEEEEVWDIIKVFFVAETNFRISMLQQ